MRGRERAEETGGTSGYPGGFLSELRSAAGPGALRQVVLKVRENDLLGLAGQLAYFFLLSFFPFLIFLVALAGLALDHPEEAVGILIDRASGFLPEEAMGLLETYVNRTLEQASSGVLIAGVVATLWLGSAASVAITKAANRAYEVPETRPFWRLRGICILMALGFTLLVAGLTLAVFKAETYFREPDALASMWFVLRWVVAFLAVTLALSGLYYLAPNASVPFRWITPGSVAASIFMFACSAGLSLYVSSLGNYALIYGQLGAVIVFMLWLYVIGLAVLIGIEVNAVLARRVERREGVEIVGAGGS